MISDLKGQLIKIKDFIFGS